MRLVKERIPKRFGFDPKTDIQVLTPDESLRAGGQEPEPSASRRPSIPATAARKSSGLAGHFASGTG